MIFDIACLILLLAAFSYGYQRGIVYMIFFLVGLGLGVLASLKFSYITANYLQQYITITDEWLPIVSLIVSFFVVFLAARFIANMLEKTLKLFRINFLNRVVGGVISVGLAASIISIAVWYLGSLNVFSSAWISTSRLYHPSVVFAPIIIEQVTKYIPTMQNLYNELNALFESYTTN